MKIAQKAIKTIAILTGILLLTALIILLIDWQETSYLKPAKSAIGNDRHYIIKNANIISMTQDTVLYQQMVYIKDGKIASIGINIETENMRVIDAQNGYLMPGLVDMHVHVWDEQELGLYLAHGITTIRNVWGLPMHLRMKEKIDNEALLAPMLFTTGPKLTGPEFIGSDNLQISSEEEAIERVKSYKDKGYDFIKTYYGLPEDIFDAIIAQAKKSDMDIVAHPSQKVPYSYHFNSQIVTVEHAEDIVQQPLNYQLDTAQLDQVVAAFSQSSSTSFCPTLIVYYNIYEMISNDDILNTEAVKLMNPLIKVFDTNVQFDRWQSEKQRDASIEDRILSQHQFHLLAVKKMHDAGVNIVCGTDAGIGITVPGQSIHQELAFYSKAGLSNYEVLKTATVNPSKTHRVMSDIGTLEENKIANLILLKNNPLEDLEALKTPDMVFIKGRRLESETLTNLETKASNRNSFMVTLFGYVENMIVEH